MRTSTLQLIAFCVCAVATMQESARSQDATTTEDATVPKLEIAQGVVFDDRNGNGNRDGDEPGIQDIRVSNGTSIVKTDKDGQYQLPVDDDSIIFVIKPRDWATPLNQNHLPQFYYIHKPKGSPANFRFAGVAPTGPLPKSIDFPLLRRVEADKFKAIMFGDPQPKNVAEVEYMSHDVIEQIISEEAHGAAFGVTLGDIVFDDLSVMEPHNQSVALIGIPWYNVIGNHDLNLDAKTDDQSDETFERFYGPSYYSFDYGPTHFMVLDDVHWHGPEGGKKGGYHGGFSDEQMTFIRNDLALIPEDQLVVLMMHIPLDGVRDREELYRLIEKRPATVSLSAHTHYMEHRFLGKENGWKGPKKHHH
ncbi:metallophosphoesterase, partial [bacterium]|nr:metallophosphoesterase [bacterium]